MLRRTYKSLLVRKMRLFLGIWRKVEGILMMTSMKHKQSLFMNAMIHVVEINNQSANDNIHF